MINQKEKQKNKEISHVLPNPSTVGLVQQQLVDPPQGALVQQVPVQARATGAQLQPANNSGKYVCELRFLDGSICAKRFVKKPQLTGHVKATQHLTRDFQCPSCTQHFRGVNGGLDRFFKHIENCGEKAQQCFQKFQSAEPKMVEKCKNCNKYCFTNDRNHNKSCNLASNPNTGVTTPQNYIHHVINQPAPVAQQEPVQLNAAVAAAIGAGILQHQQEFVAQFLNDV